MSRDYSDLSEKQWAKIDPPMLPPRNVDIQLELMEESHDIMDYIKLKHWLIDGALLCIYRDGKLLNHNQDIDWAVYSEDIQSRMTELKYMFLEEDYAVRAFKENTRLNAYKKGEMVSIQGYGLKKKHPGFRFMKKYCIPVEMFEKSELIEFNGFTYMAPAIELYLSRKYSNWKKEYSGDTKNKKYLNKKVLCAIR